MKRCKTCRHWDTSGRGMESNNTSGKEFLPCTRIPDAGVSTTWDKNFVKVFLPEFEYAKAMTGDYESYCSGINTRADFGCVMHEPPDTPTIARIDGEGSSSLD